MTANTAYEQRGYAAPIRVMPEAQATGLHQRLQRFCDGHPEDAALAVGVNCHLLSPWVYDLAMNARVLDAVEAVIGGDILVWATDFFIKAPGDGRFVSWHQDSTYWGLTPPDIVTAWIALTPSTPESGCLRVVEGSHGWGQVDHEDTRSRTNMLSRGQVAQVEVDERDAQDIVLRPGEMSLHHVRIVHGSEPNRSAAARVGFVVRYIPTTCRQTGGRTFAALARGVDDFGHFDAARRPDSPFDDAARSHHRLSVARINAVLRAGADGG